MLQPNLTVPPDGHPGPFQGDPAALLPLTVPEIRRLLAHRWTGAVPDIGLTWRWLRWRRRHQAIARTH